MATLLLLVIYISFIGLGIPDSMLGTAWPAIYTELGIPMSYAGFVAAVISLGTVVSSLMSSYLITKLGVNKISAISTVLTAIILLLFSFTQSAWLMFLLAIPLGFGAGSIDSALNNYVAVNYSAMQMNFLHCFYGVGVSVSPFIMSWVIESSLGWRGGYRIASAVQLAIALLIFATLGVWSKVQHNKTQTQPQNKPKNLSLLNTFKLRGVALSCSLFFLSCAIEFTCGNWGSTFLVETKGVLADRAAQIMMTYYIGITLGRFLSGVLTTKLKSWTIVLIGISVLGVGVITVLISPNALVAMIGVFLIGLGNGPIFPNLTHLTPQNFGEENSQSVIGVQMAAANLGVMFAPIVCGLLGQFIGIKVFPYYTLALYAIFLALTLISKKFFTKKNAKVNQSPQVQDPTED